jgi:NADH-quinone oxidoreductase subunit N
MPEFTAPSVHLGGIAPELCLIVAAFVVLLVDAVVGAHIKGHWHLSLLSSLGFIAAIVAGVLGWRHVIAAGPQLQLSGAVAFDGFAVFVKLVLACFGLLSVWLARDYLARDGLEESEFYGLVLFAVAGMMLMAGTADLIVMFVALELFSIALYVLVGFRRRSVQSQESAMKYFLLGAFSSAFFLLGIALAFGAVGSTNLYGSLAQGSSFQGLLSFLHSAPGTSGSLLVMAVGLLIVGLGFKVAAVPFHMWTPDAYQGAPSPVTGFMAAGSKIAGFAALLRLLDVALFSLRWDWRPLVVGVAVATMIVGSVLAVVQEDVKRMLAYSSIAHAGFVFTGLIAANDRGVSGSLFYLATYGISVLGAFAVVSVVAGRDEQRVRLSEYQGLFYDHPVLAGALTLFLLSLAGVPLTAGFVGKLVVFGAAIEAGYSWVVVVGVLASAVAAFFYLRVMVVMYMQEREGDVVTFPVGRMAAGVIALTASATLYFGLLWAPLIHAAQNATFYAG